MVSIATALVFFALLGVCHGVPVKIVSGCNGLAGLTVRKTSQSEEFYLNLVNLTSKSLQEADIDVGTFTVSATCDAWEATHNAIIDVEEDSSIYFLLLSSAQGGISVGDVVTRWDDASQLKAHEGILGIIDMSIGFSEPPSLQIGYSWCRACVRKPWNVTSLPLQQGPEEENAGRQWPRGAIIRTAAPAFMLFSHTAAPNTPASHTVHINAAFPTSGYVNIDSSLLFTNMKEGQFATLFIFPSADGVSFIYDTDGAYTPPLAILALMCAASGMFIIWVSSASHPQQCETYMPLRDDAFGSLHHHSSQHHSQSQSIEEIDHEGLVSFVPPIFPVANHRPQCEAAISPNIHRASTSKDKEDDGNISGASSKRVVEAISTRATSECTRPHQLVQETLDVLPATDIPPSQQHSTHQREAFHVIGNNASVFNTPGQPSETNVRHHQDLQADSYQCIGSPQHDNAFLLQDASCSSAWNVLIGHPRHSLEGQLGKRQTGSHPPHNHLHRALSFGGHVLKSGSLNSRACTSLDEYRPELGSVGRDRSIKVADLGEDDDGRAWARISVASFGEYVTNMFPQ